MSTDRDGDTASSPRHADVPADSISGAGAVPSRTRSVQAAICYTIPFIASIVSLLRHRHDVFVRLHAVQALVFFSALVMEQVALFTALVILGGWLTDPVAAFVGLGFYLVYGVAAAIFISLWLHLLADAMNGRVVARPLTRIWTASMFRLVNRIQHVIPDQAGTSGTGVHASFSDRAPNPPPKPVERQY